MAGAVTATAVQAGIFALLALSLVVVHRLPQEKETILVLPPPPRPVFRPAIVIDGRPRVPLRPSVLPPPSAIAPVILAPAPLPARPQAVPEKPQPQDLRNPLMPPPLSTRPSGNDIDLNPPSGVKDEKRWEAEMAKKNAPPDAGVSVGVGIGVVIQDPLCKLAWVLMGGGFKCGAMPAHHDATDAQVQAAVNAANARKRALSDTSVLMSPAKTGDGHAKDGTSGGAGADAGGAASPGNSEGR